MTLRRSRLRFDSGSGDVNDHEDEEEDDAFNLIVMNYYMDLWAEHQRVERELGLAGS